MFHKICFFPSQCGRAATKQENIIRQISLRLSSVANPNCVRKGVAGAERQDTHGARSYIFFTQCMHEHVDDAISANGYRDGIGSNLAQGRSDFVTGTDL